MRRIFAAAALLPLISASVHAAEPDNSFAPFDEPQRRAEAKVPRPRDPNGPGTIRCYYYPNVTVKELQFSGKGADAISVTPVQPGRALPPCGKQDDPGEIVLKRPETSNAAGVLGTFVYTVTDDGLDGFGFRIFDALTGRSLYFDAAADWRFSRAELQDGLLLFTYARMVYARCSILADGAACWSRTAQEAKLPAAVASQPPPIASCRQNYAKGAGGLPGPIPASDPSFIKYDVTMTLDRAGKSTVISRGPATCWPTS